MPVIAAGHNGLQHVDAQARVGGRTGGASAAPMDDLAVPRFGLPRPGSTAGRIRTTTMAPIGAHRWNTSAGSWPS
jgi:hypothetical protein